MTTTTALPARRTRVSAKQRRTAEAAVVAVAVLRVSTDKQERSGLGLEAQRVAVEAYCAEQGLELVAVYSDTASGTVAPDDRPGMAAALADLAAQRAGVLITAKADRLTRRTADLYALMDRGHRESWCIRTADGIVDTCSESGQLMAGVAALFAQQERRLIAARTKDATEAKRARGDRLGRALETPEATRQRVRELLLKGLTMQATAAQLNAEGITTARGKAWTWQNVQRVRNSLVHDDTSKAAKAATA